MRMYDIILKKRYNKEELSDAEIDFFVSGFTKGSIPDYQASALLMAICINGMSERETFKLTDAMLKSGDIIDLSTITGIKVDKHSTGGVADTTSLALAPILACLDLKVAKMSGRGLGFSGGTIDKLESIPNFNTSLSETSFADVVNAVGCSIIGQTTEVAPADKKLYALRDVTGTVDCMPLIASSIMSKKLASGADVILLDVKFGSGAFMKNVDDACELAELMVKIGENAGKTMGALITSMQQPLGDRAGNSLEILNVIELLQGVKSRLLTEVTEVAVKLLLLSKVTDSETHAEEMVEKVIASGEAFKRFIKMVELQGGDTSFILHKEKFELGKITPIYAKTSGYVFSINTEALGNAIVFLGGGREQKTDVIDNSVGIHMKTSIGEYVEKGQVLVDVYHNEKGLESALELINSAFEILAEQPPKFKIAEAYVDKNGVVRY